MHERELSSDFPLSPDARVQLSLTLDGGNLTFPLVRLSVISAACVASQVLTVIGRAVNGSASR